MTRTYRPPTHDELVQQTLDGVPLRDVDAALARRWWEKRERARTRTRTGMLIKSATGEWRLYDANTGTPIPERRHDGDIDHVPVVREGFDWLTFGVRLCFWLLVALASATAVIAARCL